MDQLIQITMQQVADDTIQTVDARELHVFLEVGKDFTTWIRDRIRQYGFVEEQDYVVFGSPILGNQKGRGGDRRSKEYALTLDMAKELAMVERNEKGRMARRYFIEAEKQWRAGRAHEARTADPASSTTIPLHIEDYHHLMCAALELERTKRFAIDRSRYASAVRTLIEETDLSDEEIAQRLEKVMDSRMPEWVAWNRRLLAEGRKLH